MLEHIRKFIASRIPETFDDSFVKYVFGIADQHREELDEIWSRITPQGREKFIETFGEELAKDWPREYSEMQSDKVIQELKEKFGSSIRWAYDTGYMFGRGWISSKHRTEFQLFLGDMLAKDVRTVMKGAKSRGIALASGFTRVGAEGHLAALGDRR